MAQATGSSVARSLTEADLQQSVEDLAGYRGWSKYHTRDSRRSDPGFPDLVLWRDHRLIFAELKAQKGKLTPEQETTLDGLMLTGCEVYVWRPEAWFDGEIDAVLA